MRRLIVVVLIGAVLGGCARGPKQPWGWVRVPVNKTAPSDAIIPPKAIVGANVEENAP